MCPLDITSMAGYARRGLVPETAVFADSRSQLINFNRRLLRPMPPRSPHAEMARRQPINPLLKFGANHAPPCDAQNLQLKQVAGCTHTGKAALAPTIQEPDANLPSR
jgi:hypothetical protein